MRARSITPAILLAVVASLPGGAAREPAGRAAPGDERVQANDNRAPAGSLQEGVLALRLVARVAEWHPDGEDAPGTPMAAFAEEGGPARIPGPLVRVPAGTAVSVSVSNSLADTLQVYGLHDRPAGGAAVPPPIVLAPGESRSLRFRLDVPGTFHYWGTTTRRSIEFRTLEDAQLTGAIVVDDPAAGPPRDRVFVIGMWTDTVHRAGTHRRRVLAVINGRSWPHTERLSYAVGDTVRWRVVNASADLHPMHLHGFFFRVDSRGDGTADTTYALADRRMAVTENISGGLTTSITWVPERAGNWLFHCHVPEHFSMRGSLGLEPPAHAAGRHGDHATSGMNGLVLGIAVSDSAGTRLRERVVKSERRMRLLVRPAQGSTDALPRYEYAVHEHGSEPSTGEAAGVGPVLRLVRGEPVRITVVNRLAEPTAVHWHGIELESYFDGVPGFSGAGRRVTPIIAPSDSFVVRFTPPRAGTFIYHTHADERRQQHAGLAGALVVADPGETDTSHDIALMLTELEDSAGGRGHVVLNGRRAPAPLRLKAGETYRLRVVQMGADFSAMRVELLRDSTFANWVPVAKDGADLPAVDHVPVPARLRAGIGETYDFEFTPREPGPMRLDVRQGLRLNRPAPLLLTQPIIVVP